MMVGRPPSRHWPWATPQGETHTRRGLRLAATVSTDAEAEFRAFLNTQRVAQADRIVRRIALRGFAEDGLALARVDLVPEVTITAEGGFCCKLCCWRTSVMISGAKPSSSPTCSTAPHEQSGGLSPPTAPRAS